MNEICCSCNNKIWNDKVFWLECGHKYHYHCIFVCIRDGEKKCKECNVRICKSKEELVYSLYYNSISSKIAFYDCCSVCARMCNILHSPEKLISTSCKHIYHQYCFYQLKKWCVKCGEKLTDEDLDKFIQPRIYFSNTN